MILKIAIYKHLSLTVSLMTPPMSGPCGIFSLTLLGHSSKAVHVFNTLDHILLEQKCMEMVTHGAPRWNFWIRYMLCLILNFS